MMYFSFISTYNSLKGLKLSLKYKISFSIDIIFKIFRFIQVSDKHSAPIGLEMDEYVIIDE